MSALICGSFAYDSIMVFPGRFADQILPNQIHMLNVAFLVPEMRREFGGCAGNIAYNLGLLGAEGRPMATVGRDLAGSQVALNAAVQSSVTGRPHCCVASANLQSPSPRSSGRRASVSSRAGGMFRSIGTRR